MREDQAYWLFLTVADATGITGYKRLDPPPVVMGAEATYTGAGAVGAGEVLIKAFVSDALGLTALTAGTWTFNLYGMVDSDTDVTQIVIRVYKRNSAGTETELFNVTSSEINDMVVALQTVTYAYAGDAVVITDRLVIKFFHKTASASSKTTTLYLEGVVNQSRVNVSFPVRVGDGDMAKSLYDPNGLGLTGTPALLGNGASQYQTIITGATPFIPVYSGFLLDGTTGGKTVFAITNSKTLTLTAVDNYTLTIPATGTAALLNQANSFTLINPLTTIAESWIGPSSTTGIYFKSGNVGIGTTGPLAKLDIGSPNNIGDTIGNTPVVRVIGDAVSTTAQTVLRLRRPTVMSVQYGDTVDFNMLSYGTGGVGDGYAPKTQLNIALKNSSAYAETADINIMTLRSNGNVGIGTTVPAGPLEVAKDGGANNIYNTSYRNSSGQTGWSSRFARGSLASPSVVQNGDVIGQFDFYPHNGTSFSLQTANIYTKVNGTVTGSSIPTDIIFATDAAGTAYASGKERLVILSTGNVGIGTTGPTAKLFIDGSADDEQLVVQAHSTQTANILEIQNSSATVLSHINANGTLDIGVATGTAPLVIASTTAVTNLNSDLLDGQHGAYYAPLASPIFTTPIRLKGYTVGALPAGTQGDTAFCTDLITPTFLTVAVGGGAVVGVVFYNGTIWVTI